MTVNDFWIGFGLGFSCGGWTMRPLWLWFKSHR
jgi:hypothetical protein